MDDLFVMLVSASDGACEAVATWGQPLIHDHPIGIGIDSLGNVDVGVVSHVPLGAVRHNLARFAFVRCANGVVSLSSKACLCDTGHVGPSCSLLCPGGTAAPCTNHGLCVPVGATPVCRCFDGFVLHPLRRRLARPTYARSHRYYGTACNTTCPCLCSSHGYCDDGNCRCETGFVGAGCNISCPSVEGKVCNDKGMCDAAGACHCVSGYGGPDCGMPDNSTCPMGTLIRETCSGRGVCQESTGTCICLSGFGGSSCELECPGAIAANTCNDHGACSAVDGTCFCDENWVGSACSVECPRFNDTACGSNGLCVLSGATAECKCVHGWTGAACSETITWQSDPSIAALSALSTFITLAGTALTFVG
ncbi:MAG: hypothetical protein WC732_10010 [Candidatus Omnitrophota bacterium]